MAIAMPMHKNGPNANWLFRFAILLGEQQRAEAAAEQNADERGNDRQLCAEEKARAEHQLDITAAHSTFPLAK